MTRQKNRKHLLEKKGSSRTRRLAGEKVLESKGDTARVKRLLNQ
jgi:ribosomal protein L35